MRWVVLGVAAATVACGGDGSPLEGVWVYEDPGFECATAIRFDPDAYRLVYSCRLTDDTLGAVVEDGIYSYTDERLTLTVTAWSCSGLGPAFVRPPFGAEVDGERLRLSFPEGIQVFQLFDLGLEDATPGAIAFGCFDDMGLFTPNAIGPP